MLTNTVQSQTHHHMPKPANSGPVTDFQDSVDGGAGNDRYTRLLLQLFTYDVIQYLERPVDRW